MDRAPVALALALCGALSTPALASPKSLELGFGGGVGYASRAGGYRDDDIATLRIGIGVTPQLSIDFGLAEDVERVESAIHAGARLRRIVSPLWSPYLRGDLALVNASHFGSNVDITLGVGHWGHFTRSSWLAWYVETNVVLRFGEPETVSGRIEGGLAIAPSFWR